MAALGGYTTSGALAAAPQGRWAAAAAWLWKTNGWERVAPLPLALAEVEGTLGWPAHAYDGRANGQPPVGTLYPHPHLRPVAWRPRCGHNNRDRTVNAGEFSLCSPVKADISSPVRIRIHEGNCSIGEKRAVSLTGACSLFCTSIDMGPGFDVYLS